MTIIASTELILIQTMCSGKLRMDFFHSGKHIMDIILLIRRVMLGAPSLWEIICKWPALWCCRVINKSSYQNEKWNFKNERVSINLGHWWYERQLRSECQQPHRWWERPECGTIHPKKGQDHPQSMTIVQKSANPRARDQIAQQTQHRAPALLSCRHRDSDALHALCVNNRRGTNRQTFPRNTAQRTQKQRIGTGSESNKQNPLHILIIQLLLVQFLQKVAVIQTR